MNERPHGVDVPLRWSDICEVRDPSDAGLTLYARAETTLVACDFATGRPRRLSLADRAALKGVAGDPVALSRRQRAT